MIKPDIIDIVLSEGVDIVKRGHSYKGLCPFHDEKTPSFIVNPSRQTFHCFGCGERGDVIDFIMKRHRMVFNEALSHLGVEGEPSAVILEKVAQSAIKRQKRLSEEVEVREVATMLNKLPEAIEKAVRLQKWHLLKAYYDLRTKLEFRWFELTKLEI